MKVTFENNTLYLPIVEAKNIKVGLATSILFEIPETKISDYNALFNFENSEPSYPCVLLPNEKSKLAEKYKLNSAAIKIKENDLSQCYQLAVFWHFLGDATHHSDYVNTPFGFYPGLEIQIENRYNVKPTNAFIKDIQLTRLNSDKWFWLVVIERI